MPKKYKKRSFRKGRYNRRKGRKGRRTGRRRMLTITPGRALFPPMTRVNLRYENSGQTVNVTSGVPAGLVFRATGIYDPEYAAGGGQPRGFDQIAPFFDSWVVVGAKLSVQVASNATSGNNSGYITALTTDENAISAATRDYFEDRFIRKSMFGPASGGKNTAFARTTYSARKWHGAGGRVLMQNTDLIGTETSDPAKNTYFHVVLIPVSDGAASSCFVRFWIDYSVIFFGPKLITAS